MNEQEEAKLQIALGEGPIFWNCEGSPFSGRRITTILAVKSEPGLCAFLEGGGYVALYNADLSQFICTKSTANSSEDGAPNLDCMTSVELYAFYNRIIGEAIQSKAEQLFPKRPYRYVLATLDLACYAKFKAIAQDYRTGGEINAALFYEGLCESIYARLPMFARW